MTALWVRRQFVPASFTPSPVDCASFKSSPLTTRCSPSMVSDDSPKRMTLPGVAARSVMGLFAVPRPWKTMVWLVQVPSAMTSVSPGFNLSETPAMSAAEETRYSAAGSVKAATPHPSHATKSIRCIKFRATDKDYETRHIPRAFLCRHRFALTAGRPNVKHWRHHVSDG